MLDVLINKPEEEVPGKGIFRVSDRADKPIKSVMKAVSWRIVGTIDTMLISYIITGKATVAISIGSIEVITKTVLYYFHERVWAHIHRIKLFFIRKSNGSRLEIKRAERFAQKQVN